MWEDNSRGTAKYLIYRSTSPLDIADLPPPLQIPIFNPDDGGDGDYGQPAIPQAPQYSLGAIDVVEPNVRYFYIIGAVYKTGEVYGDQIIYGANSPIAPLIFKSNGEGYFSFNLGGGTATVDMGDGTVIEGSSTSEYYEHHYTEPGDYTVTLTLDEPIETLYFGADELVDWGGGYHRIIVANHNTILPLQLSPNITCCRAMLSDWDFTSDISGWDVSAVTDMAGMFSRYYSESSGQTGALPDLSTWDVSNVWWFNSTFNRFSNFNLGIGNWDVSSAIDMSFMFRESNNFGEGIGAWNVSNVISMSKMFEQSTNIKDNLSEWDVGKVFDMYNMFRESDFNQDIGDWDVSKVTNMRGMFEWCNNFNQDLSEWCVKNFHEEPYDFNYGANNWSLPLPVWGTCPPRYDKSLIVLKHWFDESLGDTEQVTVNFAGSSALIDIGDGSGPIEYLNTFTSTFTDFTLEPTITIQLLSNCDLVEVDSKSLFKWGSNYNSIKFLGQIEKVPSNLNRELTSTLNMFSGCTNFDSAIGTWNMSAVTNTSGMFSGCTMFNQDVSRWDVSKVTNMSNMFSGCTSFDGYVGDWLTDNVTDMTGMFNGCTLFDDDLSYWCVSSITEVPSDFDTDTTSWTLPKPVWGTCIKVLRFVMSDGAIVRPRSLGYIEDYEAELTLVGDKLQISGDGVREVLDWRDRPPYAPDIIGYEFLNARGLMSVPTELPTWISDVTNMFNGCSNFNQDLSGWDVSAFTSMAGMFSDAEEFNSDLSTWNVSAVTDMSQMFYRCRKFNRNIGTWDVSGVTNMTSMFAYCREFNQDLTTWNTSNVTNMSSMFTGCESFNGDISTWDVSNLTNTRGMFAAAMLFDQDLSQWDVSSVTDMSQMFYNCRFVKLNISDWNTSNVTNMSQVFYDCFNFDDYIGDWDVSKVTNMTEMLRNARSFNQDLSRWCVSRFSYAPSYFNYNASMWTLPKPIWGTCPPSITFRLQDGTQVTPTELGAVADSDIVISLVGTKLHVTGNDIVEVVTMNKLPAYAKEITGYLFDGCTNLVTVPPMSPYKITDMANMFKGCTSFNSDLSAWDVSGVTDMTSMFEGCSSYNQAMEHWDIRNVTSLDSMFKGCSEFNQDIGFWCVSNFPSKPTDFNTGTSMWTLPKPVWGTCPQPLTLRLNDGRLITPRGEGDISGTGVVLTKNGTVMTVSGSSIVEITKWGTKLGYDSDITGYVIESSYLEKVPATLPSWVLTTKNMFSGCTRLNSDLSAWDVSSVTDMSYMFNDCSRLQSDLSMWDVSKVTSMKNTFRGCSIINSDFSTWNTISVTDMSSMFYGCNGLVSSLSDWNTSNVTDMSGMFAECGNFRSDVSKWDVSNVTNMSSMFKGCSSFTMDNSDWDVSNVTNMSSMFSKCRGSMNFSNWDVSKVTNMSRMFEWCSYINGTMGSWDVSNVTDMNNMFYYAQNFKGDLSTWDVSSVTNMGGMFNYAYEYNSPMSDWDVSNVVSMGSMFANAQKFNQDISSWDVSKVTSMDSMFSLAIRFNQDLSLWCVSRFSREPNYFSRTTDDWLQPKPVWGTCPKPLTLELSDGRIVTPYELGSIPDSNVTLSRVGDKLHVTGSDVVAVTEWVKVHRYAKGITGYVFEGCTNLATVPVTMPAMVNDFSDMFKGCTSFNSDISSWYVGEVTSMTGMFNGATSFNQDLSGWCVSSSSTLPTDFDTGATSWTLPKPVWGTCPTPNEIAIIEHSDGSFTYKATETAVAGNFYIVRGVPVYVAKDNIDLKAIVNKYNSVIQDRVTTSMVVGLNGTYLISLNQVVTTLVTDMYDMFYNVHMFNQDISQWDVSNVTRFDDMFYQSRWFNRNITNWDVSSCTSMDSMFYECNAFNQDLSSWCVSNITSKPTNFDSGTNQWILPKPVWGTCPVRG